MAAYGGLLAARGQLDYAEPILIEGWEELPRELGPARRRIARHLAHVYAERGDRALMRCVVAEMHAGFGALRRTLPFNCRATGRQVAIDADTARDIDRIQAIWRDCLNRRGASGGGLFGGFTLAHLIANNAPHPLIEPYALARFKTLDFILETGTTAR